MTVSAFWSPTGSLRPHRFKQPGQIRVFDRHTVVEEAAP